MVNKKPGKPIYLILGKGTAAIGHGEMVEGIVNGNVAKRHDFKYSGILTQKVPLFNIPNSAIETGRRFIQNGVITNTEFVILWHDIFTGELTNIKDGNMIRTLQAENESMNFFINVMESELNELRKLIEIGTNKDKIMEHVLRFSNKLTDIKGPSGMPFFGGGMNRSFTNYGNTGGGDSSD